LKSFWAGTRGQYFELYRHTAAALKAVDAGLQVGGPATAANAWIHEFLEFCEDQQLPADFVSTHHYPNDPLWSPAQQTEEELAGGRRGILGEWVRRARRQAGDRPLFFTEWNASSNPRYARQDEPYAAAFAAKSALEAAGVADAYAFWTFTDIFEENYFPSLPFHGGFGLLTLHGIAKPTYRAFELLHRLGNEQLPLEGAHPTVDAWAARCDDQLTVLLTNHALPRQPIAAQTVHLELPGARPPQAVLLERIDDDHANARAAWLRMGAPEYPNTAQLEQLEQASRLAALPQPWDYHEGTLHVRIELPAHGVAALTFHGCLSPGPSPDLAGEPGRSP
jgi:xylan 1,4-beta-xylosidase